jgi:spermidine synthase
MRSNTAPAARAEAVPLPRSRAILTEGTQRWLVLLTLAVLFFSSGISGLIYQVVWVRMLSLAFGVTVHAISTVLAAFMAGLALGSFAGGWPADRVRRPLALYGLVEIFIGLTGLLTPSAFTWLQGFYREVHLALEGQDALAGLVRLLLAFGILLVPTSLMGATLPIIIRSSFLREQGHSANISLLYACNTAGAIVGCFTAGFVLIGGIGTTATIHTAATINIAVGIAAVILSFVFPSARGVDRAGAGAHEEAAPAPTAPPYPALAVSVVFWAYGISGGISLAYEVVWSRVLALFFNSSIYAFTLMLTTVLLGIALGSYLVTPLMGRRLNWVLVFGLIELIVALCAIASVHALADMSAIIERLRSWPGVGGLMQTEEGTMALIAAVTVLPAMLLLGATFPVAARVYTEGRPDVGRRVGRIYSVNVFGAIFGSYLAGFLLVPLAGSQRSLFILGYGNLALGLALLAVATRTHLLVRAALVLVLVLPSVHLTRTAPDMYERIFRSRFPDAQVLWYREALENTVSLVKGPNGVTTMYTNSRGQASDDPGLVRFHALIGHLPMLLHRDPRNVLIVGIGGGTTTAAVASYPQARVDAVELSDGVVQAVRYWRSLNGDVLNRPNVHLHIDDARNYLLLTTRRYDVIAADVIRPWDAGSNNLYAVEYYRLAYNALEDDGLMVQWLASFSDFEYKLIMRTFLEVFPQVTLWFSGDLLIGSKQPITIDRGVLEAKLHDPQVREALAKIGVTNTAQIISWFAATDAELRRYAGPGPIITDDRPLIEYFRSLPPRRDPPDLSWFSRDPRSLLRG